MTPSSKMHPIILGIMNVTPDSFSDGGEISTPDLQLKRAVELIQDGAHVLDIGAESTRPGSKPVSLDDEWQRLNPLLKLLSKNLPGTPMSVDTQKLEIARRAADLGVTWVNLIGREPKTEDARDLKNGGIKNIVAMHVSGTPETMQDNPLNSAQALTAVESYFDRLTTIFTSAGFQKNQLYFDPGIGFGKTDCANLRLLNQTNHWAKSRQIALGVSRKSLLGRTLNISEPKDRDNASKMLELGLVMLGASLIRTHAPKKLSLILKLLFEEGIPC